MHDHASFLKYQTSLKMFYTGPLKDVCGTEGSSINREPAVPRRQKAKNGIYSIFVLRRLLVFPAQTQATMAKACFF